MRTGRPAVDVGIRLMKRIQEKESGCIEWIGKRGKQGYGEISDVVNGKKKTLKTHRVSYETFKGKIPIGLHVLHKCDNPPCINPNHLFLGTARDNLLDMSRKGRCRNQNGSNNNMSKLDEESVKEILKTNCKLKYLAKIYGVKESTISRIKHGIRWGSFVNKK